MKALTADSILQFEKEGKIVLDGHTLETGDIKVGKCGDCPVKVIIVWEHAVVLGHDSDHVPVKCTQ